MDFSREQKIEMVRRLTRGAEDCFAVRGDDKWRPCYSPLPDDMIVKHLAGAMEIGSYPLIPFGNGLLPNVWWVAADFDGKKPRPDGLMPSYWKRDVSRAVQWLKDLGPSIFVNLSRSAQGAHVRVLFREPVPAWMARRWMKAWLDEAQVTEDSDENITSYDRLIPPQDALSGRLDDHGRRMPGNLIGSPLNGRRAHLSGGTLPLDPERVAVGDFEPDGDHWSHVAAALERETWGIAELEEGLREAPGLPVSTPPSIRSPFRLALPVITADSRKLDYALMFCDFMKHIQQPGAQTYALWVALATQLHRYGDEGHRVFHEISAVDPRYSQADTDRKWRETMGMFPIRCDTLVTWGYRCPHLGTDRCNGVNSPTHFADYTEAEIL